MKNANLEAMLIRIPKNVKRELEKEAKEQHRSLSAHVWAKLENAINHQKAAKVK